MDAESNQEYNLELVASDQFGEGTLVSVPLVVGIINENDNTPVFERDVYVASMRENETEPYDPRPLQVRVSTSAL